MAVHRPLLVMVGVGVVTLAAFIAAGSDADEPIEADERGLASAEIAQNVDPRDRPGVEAAEGFVEAVTSEDEGKVCTTITFEGVGDSSPIPEFDGITSPGWLGIIDEDAGGTGNFAFEPSPSTIAFWLGDPAESRDIVFADPVSEVSFFYASYVDVFLYAFDAEDNLISTASGPPNWDQGPGGDPNGYYNKWDPLGVTAQGSVIARVTVSGNVNQTGIDNLKVCRGLGISKVEFTQAIQEWQTPDELEQYLATHNGEPPVPIVSRKPAALRVYLDKVQTTVQAKVQVRYEPPIDGVISEAWSWALQPNCTSEQQRRQEKRCESFDFFFTPPVGSWKATAKLFDKDNNELESHTFNITSRNVQPLILEPMEVCDSQRFGFFGPWLCAPGEELDGLLTSMRASAPTHRVLTTSTTWRVMLNTSFFLFPFEQTKWWTRVVRKIQELCTTGRYCFGTVRSEVAGTIGGIALIGGRGAASRVGWRVLGVDIANEAVAHEATHMLGRYHTGTDLPRATGGRPPGCWDRGGEPWAWPYTTNSIQEVGFDVAHGRALLPEKTFDRMGYCTPTWISPYTYRGVMGALGDRATDQLESPVSASFWQVSGILEDATLSLAPLFILETEGPAETGSGSHRIDVLDAQGASLFTRFFEPVRVSTTTTTAEEMGDYIFAELVPVQDGAARIVIRNPDGNELAGVVLGGVAPTVTITFPAGGETLSGEHELTWQVTDPDSATYTFRVEYSPDAGASWHGLASEIDEPALTVNFDDLPGCSNSCLIRVLASDGVNTGVGVSNAFSVPTKGPTAEVVFPEDDSLFKQGDLVWLQGSGWDADDGYLEGAALSWQSSRDGFLGNGDSLPITSLSEGTHVITFTATDTEANTASDFLTVQVDASPPVLDLTVVPDGTPASCVQVTIDAADEPGGSALDAVEYSLDGGETWNPGCLGDQPFSFIVPGQGFVHLVVRAADAAGNSTAKDERFFIETECWIPDSDGDDVPDASDNCPFARNFCQEDRHPDGIGNHCDDPDVDGFTDYVETYVGCDPDDACPDTIGDDGDDAWPPDIKIDRVVNVLDVVTFRPHLFGVVSCCAGDAACYDSRHDLDANTCINVLDVVKLRPHLWTQCTNP